MSAGAPPLTLYGISVSYYTGKIEAYLRFKRIPYRRDHPYGEHRRRLGEQIGAIQVPLIELPDGRLLQDSTPMIRHFEEACPQRPVLPADPATRFIALLIEDYGDEWLWRPAMHYRWSYPRGREFIGRVLAEEVMGHLWFLPFALRRLLIQTRQRYGFVVNDGVSADTVAHVEQGYRAALAAMTSILEEQPFLLGPTPSVADFGMLGPMLRHFSQDPEPAEIMRREAPAVFEWVARMWNAGRSIGAVEPGWAVPAAAEALLREICDTHLVQLRENASAFARGASSFAMNVQGCAYRDLPVSRYRVYCLERLREEFALLDGPAQASVRALLPHPQAALLWEPGLALHSGYDAERQAPFCRGINVYDLDLKRARF
jgi:glutathione S-transferase